MKILILGDAGRGKTTFAEILSEKLDIPKYSTDDFYWEIKFTKPRGKDKDIEMAKEVFDTKDNWIVEGTTIRMLKLGLEKADKIFYLRYKNIIYQTLALYKRNRGRKNENLKNLFDLIIHQVKKKNKWGELKHKESFDDLLRLYENKVIRLESFIEMDRYLKTL